MLTRLNLSILITLFYSSFINAQSELRLGVLTIPNQIKENYGLQLEYAIPVFNFFEIAPSVLALRNNYIDTYFPYECTVGERYLNSKQRYALKQMIDKGFSNVAMVGIAIKPLAKISKRHDLAIGGNFGYGYSQSELTYKVENEDGTFEPVPYINEGKGYSGGILLQLRYAFLISKHSKIGVRYYNEPTFYNWAGLGSIYYAYKF